MPGASARPAVPSPRTLRPQAAARFCLLQQAAYNPQPLLASLGVQGASQGKRERVHAVLSILRVHAEVPPAWRFPHLVRGDAVLATRASSRRLQRVRCLPSVNGGISATRRQASRGARAPTAVLSSTSSALACRNSARSGAAGTRSRTRSDPCSRFTPSSSRSTHPGTARPRRRWPSRRQLLF